MQLGGGVGVYKCVATQCKWGGYRIQRWEAELWNINGGGDYTRLGGGVCVHITNGKTQSIPECEMGHAIKG